MCVWVHLCVWGLCMRVSNPKLIHCSTAIPREACVMVCVTMCETVRVCQGKHTNTSVTMCVIMRVCQENTRTCAQIHTPMPTHMHTHAILINRQMLVLSVFAADVSPTNTHTHTHTHKHKSHAHTRTCTTLSLIDASSCLSVSPANVSSNSTLAPFLSGPKAHKPRTASKSHSYLVVKKSCVSVCVCLCARVCECV
jgi:hypothetical protein